MKVTGACHCGAIRYEAEIDPATGTICHCTDCQVLSGTAFRTTVRAIDGTFRLLAGTPRIYTRVADSGNRREQGFCDRCGTPIYATSPGPEPKLYGLRVGNIDQRAQLRPAAQIWARSRLPWIGELGALPSSEKQ
ncbi:MAG TPA: GFA family protein [Kofleriaceae bacterium]|nr:GFA family protein [Kofleriaceae bacterium]